MEQVYVYQWGFWSREVTSPEKETIESYISRNRDKLTSEDKAGIEKYIEKHIAEVNQELMFFVGTEKEFEIYKIKYFPIQIKSRIGKMSVVDAVMFSTLTTYATEYKTGKVVEILTVLNQLARASMDSLHTVTINQDYERVLHSMLIEMYTNHRELYTAMFYEAQLEESYELGIVVDFLKQIFANSYLLDGTRK